MKKPLKIVLVILGLVILANVAIFATGDVHVKSSSSGLLTTNDHYTRYNSFFKFHFPDFFYGEYSVETATKHGMSNFVVEAPIVAEGLITQFNMTDTINSIAGVFYEVDIFYSNGRIFFEKNDKLYEFVAETGRLRTIGSIDDALSIEYIYAS